MSVRCLAALLALAALLLPRNCLAAGPPPILVDDFENTAPWSAVPADGVLMKLSSDTGAKGKALRIDFDFAHGGGYAVARRDVDLTLPDRYAFVVRLRGECRVNNLEIKLVDSTGANVWWCNRRDFVFPRDWMTLTTRKRQISFAWGPIGGGEIRRVKAIEFAITAGQGGKGSVWLDQLELKELPPPSDQPPRAKASSSVRSHEPEKALDGDAKTSWSSGDKDRRPWIVLDFGSERELGGLVLDWAPGRHLNEYAVEIPAEGDAWRTLRTVEGNGGRDYIALPETDASALRIRALEASGGCALFEAKVQPLDWAATYEKFFQAVASDAPRGSYPRAIAGEQSYWTVVGLDRDPDEALMSEDGAIEAGKRGFSIEPFLFLDGKLRTWADVRTTRRLEDDVLPIPTVRWEVDSVALEITAFAAPRDSSAVFGRYRLKNDSPRPRRATLYLALRPFQVNPPAQFLNTQGGVSPIHRLTPEGRRLRVGADRDVVSLTEADGFGATTFDQGNVVDWLRSDRLPPETAVIDSFGFASGALAYRIELEPGASREVDLLIPLRGRSPARGIADVEGSFRLARDAWRQALGTVGIELPDSAAAIAHAVRAQLGFIMVNRDGPSIQPGSRAYERSWIRDGSLTCSALLRFGHEEMVRDFIDWFGPHQYENGKIPCCADHRGADPVPEHDSHGEFIYLVAEYFRFTADRASLERWWPRVAKAAAYMDTLRAQRRTPEYLAPEKKEFYGLLPPSISHEGYSAKPMHSYWDDLFALRGYKDAVYLAGVLGRTSDRARLERSRDQFFRDLNASIDAAMKKHKIPYIPGCADLGDYDATSTTIALSPVQAWPSTDERLVRTFAGYWDWFTKRRNGTEAWEAYTPYEWRTVGAFVRLGQRERAQQALDWFMRHQRPSGWRQWPEVVWRDERAPKFIGDLPHTWVGSDFVRSVLDMIAYEREAGAGPKAPGQKSGDQLILAAGIPEAWLLGTGVSVRGLRTRFGALDFTLRREDGGAITGRVAGVKPPPGGIILDLRREPGRWTATINGKSAPITKDGEVVITQTPAEIKLAPSTAR